MDTLEVLEVLEAVLLEKTDRHPAGAPGGKGGEFRSGTTRGGGGTTRGGGLRSAREKYREENKRLTQLSGRFRRFGPGLKDSSLARLITSLSEARSRVDRARQRVKDELYDERKRRGLSVSDRSPQEAARALGRKHRAVIEVKERNRTGDTKRVLDAARGTSVKKQGIDVTMEKYMPSMADVHTRGPVDVERRSKRKGKKRGEVEVTMAVEKTDTDQRMVWGWASVTKVNGRPLVDLQGDVIETEELQKAVHEFVRKKRVMGDMHTVIGVGDVVDSIVLTEDLQQALGIDLGKEGWFVGVHVTNDNTWGKIKKGDLRGFSIGGFGVRETIIEEEDGVNKAWDVEREILLALAETLAGVS